MSQVRVSLSFIHSGRYFFFFFPLRVLHLFIFHLLHPMYLTTSSSTSYMHLGEFIHSVQPTRGSLKEMIYTHAGDTKACWMLPSSNFIFELIAEKILYSLFYSLCFKRKQIPSKWRYVRLNFVSGLDTSIFTFRIKYLELENSRSGIEKKFLCATMRIFLFFCFFNSEIKSFLNVNRLKQGKSNFV